ncbi:MAG: hypothetical protein ACLTC4_17260 [Hungatella hathewayi]
MAAGVKSKTCDFGAATGIAKQSGAVYDDIQIADDFAISVKVPQSSWWRWVGFRINFLVPLLCFISN